MLEFALNGRSYSQQQLIDLSAQPVYGNLTPYEQHTLQFCHQWLSGQECFKIKTSGSTGHPKIITLRREHMVASARLTAQALDLQQGDRALVGLSTEYIAGMMMLVRGFELGLPLTVIPPQRNPLGLFSDETRFDFTALAPIQFLEMFTATPGKAAILENMRAVIVGGAPLSEALLEQINTLSVPVYHTYGMTETVSHVALKRLNGPSASDYFVPLSGVQLTVDEQSCLTVNAPMTGYKSLSTHDRVDLQSDGSFLWLGRIDNVINTGGIKVQAEKVEQALARLLRIYRGGIYKDRRFFVGPQTHSQFGQQVAAVIEGEPISPNEQAVIQDELLLDSALGNYEIPRSFHFLPQLLETPTGKIDRLANLRALAI
ncbi:MAG: AMP-binding protein [Candidatus Competibacteraceae bacterium]|jgi:O-succinylbenzoic acid--CoA ligase|nr:AMP-binding protein [Candidatus Competibacteraceae bacterium]